MITADNIENWIEAGLPNSRAAVEGDDGQHF